ncbi:hypothetical protein R6242_18920 [Iodobacter sp. CM08]|uniref:hypothetical protein n=1 Tax=Iodobacter sp. CM08 TaxID=3085902 RepID=UPI002981524C|nr:hypothetical protein [Iodobacter sp. CM08]MDW5418642.1 hypothetical protein [Iodobacter sp. CM08]
MLINAEAINVVRKLSGAQLAQYAAQKNLAAEMVRSKVKCTFDGQPIEAAELASLGPKGAGAGMLTSALLILSGCGFQNPALKFLRQDEEISMFADASDKVGWIMAAFAASYVAREWVLSSFKHACEKGELPVDEEGNFLLEIKHDQQKINLLPMQQIAQGGSWEIKSNAPSMPAQNNPAISDFLMRI